MKISLASIPAALTSINTRETARRCRRFEAEIYRIEMERSPSMCTPLLLLGGQGEALDLSANVDHMHKQGFRRNVSKSNVEEGSRWKYVWVERDTSKGDSNEGDPVEAVLVDEEAMDGETYRIEDVDECFYAVDDEDEDDEDDEVL